MIAGTATLWGSPGNRARLCGERPEVRVEAVAMPEPEPIHLLRRRLARDLPISDLGDFFVFEATRQAARGMVNDQFPDALSRQFRGLCEFELLPSLQETGVSRAAASVLRSNKCWEARAAAYVRLNERR